MCIKRCIVHPCILQLLHKLIHRGIAVYADLFSLPVDVYADSSRFAFKAKLSHGGIFGISCVQLAAGKICGFGQLAHLQGLHAVHGALTGDYGHHVTVGNLGCLFDKRAFESHIAQSSVKELDHLGI